MVSVLKKFATFLLVAICYSSVAQKTVEEDELSFSVLSGLYENYPNVQSAVWRENQTKLGAQYQVSFEFEKQRYKVILDSRGKRIGELRYLSSTPIDIINVLYEQFDQFKIKEVAVKTVFPSKEKSYIATIKGKSFGIQNIELDENIKPISNNVALNQN